MTTMTTDLAQSSRTQPDPIVCGNRGLEPRGSDEFLRLANMVWKSGLSPKSLDSPEKIVIAAQTGMEAGLKFMQALRSIVVINGLPSWKGDMALALVRSTGKISDFKVRWGGSEGKDDWACTISSARDGHPCDATTFSVADAKRAGLWGRQGPWTQYPKRMLYYRAIGFHLRDNYSDILSGLAIAEEVEDYPADAFPKQGRVIQGPPPSDPLLDGPQEAPVEPQELVIEVPAEAPAEPSAEPEKPGEPTRHQKIVTMLAEISECTDQEARERLDAYARSVLNRKSFDDVKAEKTLENVVANIKNKIIKVEKAA